MSKTAFVFSGQGAQFPGMGKAFYERDRNVRALFDEAEMKRPGTLETCFSGDANTLCMTENTQPCLYLSALAGAISLAGAGVRADAVSGFSLGEIAALAFAGAYSPTDGFDIVCRRGQLMGEAARKYPAAMVAVVKLDASTVERLCRPYKNAYPVNYNSDDQTVVAVAAEEKDAFSAEVKAAGGRAIPLSVSGGFHSPFMDGASRLFGKYLDDCTIALPRIPVYSNCTARPYKDAVRPLLEMQMRSPVLWKDSVVAMGEAGIDTFIEVGAGSTLVKLIRKILPEAAVFSVGDTDDVAAVREALQERRR